MVVSKVWNGRQFINTDSDTVDGFHAGEFGTAIFKDVFATGSSSWVFVASADTNTFTLPKDTYDPLVHSEKLYYYGLKLRYNEHYTMSGNTVTLTFTIKTGEKIEVTVVETGYAYDDLVGLPAIGNLDRLTTLNKDTIVDAINEVNAKQGGGPVEVDWGLIKNIPSEFPPAPHNHDASYYTKAQIDYKLLNEIPTGNYNDLTNLPSINGVTIAGELTTEDLKISIPTQMFCYDLTIRSSDWTQDGGEFVYTIQHAGFNENTFVYLMPDRPTNRLLHSEGNKYLLAEPHQGGVEIVSQIKPTGLCHIKMYWQEAQTKSKKLPITGRTILNTSPVRKGE